MKKYAILIFAFLITVEVFGQGPGKNMAPPPPPPPPPAQQATPPPSQPTQQDDFQIPPEVQQGQAQPGQPGAAQPTATNVPPEMGDPLLEGFFEDIQYNPADKRDPFLPYLTPAQRMTQGPQAVLEPLQKFALNELKLVGIIWDVGQPKALIQDPTGKSHIIVENTKLGQSMGYVAAIREGEIIVVETQITAEGRKSFTTKIMKLSTAIAKGT